MTEQIQHSPKATDADDGLFDIANPLPAGEYLRRIAERRDFVFVVPYRIFRSSNSRTVLGSLWHILNPLLMIFVYWLIFSVLLDVNRGVPNPISFLAVGVFFYRYMQRTITGGADSITGNIGLIRSIYFPRMILPLQAAIERTYEFAASSIAMFAFILLTGDSPQLSWVFAPLIALAAGTFGLGGGMIAARLNEATEDFSRLLPILFRVAFYASGVIYPVALRVQSPEIRTLFTFNPFYAILSVARAALLAYPMNWATLWSTIGWATITPVVGFVYFRRAEHKYGR